MDVIYPDEFKRAVERVLQDEGEYICDPQDPGGATKFGISKRSYPSLDIERLTRAEAIAIYWRDWWRRYGFDRIASAEVASKLFELAVNMGAESAIKCLQRAVHLSGGAGNLAEDGILGPATLAAINGFADLPALGCTLRMEAARHYIDLVIAEPSRLTFLRGWVNRAYAA